MSGPSTKRWAVTYCLQGKALYRAVILPPALRLSAKSNLTPFPLPLNSKKSQVKYHPSAQRGPAPPDLPPLHAIGLLPR